MSAYMEPGLDILDAIDRSALVKRGTLRAWMVTNHQAFSERLETRKPDWPTLAKVFADAGLLDTRGKAPTAEATRKTWYRIKAEMRKTATAATAPIQTTREVVTNVSRPAGSFSYSATPKEDDKARLFGKPADRTKG
jgi:hypothetical protein